MDDDDEDEEEESTVVKHLSRQQAGCTFCCRRRSLPETPAYLYQVPGPSTSTGSTCASTVCFSSPFFLFVVEVHACSAHAPVVKVMILFGSPCLLANGSVEANPNLNPACYSLDITSMVYGFI